MIDLQLFGNINATGMVKVDGNKRIIDILNEDAQGLKDEKNLEILQIGGPLGVLVTGEDQIKPLSDFPDVVENPTIMFLNGKFCPVDFSKFLLTYVKRELRHESEELEILLNLIEELSSGKTRKYTYEELVREVAESSSDQIAARIKANIQYLMTRYKPVFIEHFEDKKCAEGICYRLFSAQCINACPASINIPGYIALMYEGQDEKAYRLMRQNNPLSLICGKICARPCESRCRRGEIEKTVGVRALKHYAATYALDKGGFDEGKAASKGKKVGIIGAGPAGLSAAYYLAKTGYEVHIYEKHPVVGGMLAVGVPAYRLAQSSIDKEVKLIENLGVTIHKNVEVGKDITFDELNENHDSILLATGCHLANTFSDHLNNLEGAIDFLREVKLEGRSDVGKNVVVIGGGDVAMDAARTSLRLGAEKVTVISLETYNQMPASDEEKEEAQEEGITFVSGYGTKVIHEQDQIADGITVKKVTSLYDLNNRFSPVYDENETLNFSCDQILLAIGQRSDNRYLGPAVSMDDRGRIQYDKDQKTTLSGVYVAGDISGPGSAIKAIAEGRKAALEIDNYLGGNGLFTDEVIEVPEAQSHYSIWDTEPNLEKIALFKAGDNGDFIENRSVLTTENARLEAMRCMRCDRNSRQ